ncbi:MAG: TetR/AcrR family transcriptional regulator [Myxococcota bacterium]|nr:TetR/AcrR family transcriptional regulator [Myxococcota bacterium]
MATRDAQRRETHQRIYESALAIFRRDGVSACRTDDIATAAGVSRGAFYFHFPTKEHVLLERMQETEAIICARLDALAEDAPIECVLAQLNQSLAAIWEPDPKLLPDLVGAALRFTALTMHDQQATPLRSALAARFRDAAARGEIVGRLPPEILGDVYLGNTLGGLLAWYGNPVMPLRSVLDAVTDLFWAGAGAPLSAAKKKTTKKSATETKKKTKKKSATRKSARH